jgi:hypothetical protein
VNFKLSESEISLGMKSKKDPESQQLLKAKSEDPHLREPINEQEKRVLLPQSDDFNKYRKSSHWQVE